jgi:hypothetical protein
MTHPEAHRSVPEIRGGGRNGACADLVRTLASGEGPLRFPELVYFCDPDGAEVPRGSRADHCDHIHGGMDA